MTFDTRWCAVTDAVAASVVTATGERIDYRAGWSALELLDETGELLGTVSATSYTTGDPTRPVAFVWNGGPGASSSPLHTRAFGPRSLEDGAFVPNPHTLLSHADLVFIDPPGTGFSLIHGDGPSPLRTPTGDARAVELFLRQWLAREDRHGVVVHLIGESYGGYRLALLSEHVGDLPVGAIVLVSPLLDPTASSEGPANDLSLVFALPTMAAAAAFHGRIDTTDPGEAWRRADDFATEVLLPVLHRGMAVDAERIEELAVEMATLIGVPPAELVGARLRLGSEDFLRLLRADDGLVVGRLDTRVVGPLLPPHPEGRPAAADDPALGLGRSGNVIRSAPIAAYLHDELGVPADDYISLSLDVNFAFDWASSWAPGEFAHSRVDRIAGLLDAVPTARVLVTGGIFDLATPLAGTLWAVRHGIPQDRLTVEAFRSGHSLDADTLPTIHAAVARAFEELT